MVSHHSTLPAQRSLTAESGRDPVFSPWYDRRQHTLLCTALSTTPCHPFVQKPQPAAPLLPRGCPAACRNPPCTLPRHAAARQAVVTTRPQSNWPQNEASSAAKLTTTAKCTVSTLECLLCPMQLSARRRGVRGYKRAVCDPTNHLRPIIVRYTPRFNNSQQQPTSAEQP